MVVFELNSEEGKEGSYARIWGKSIACRENGRCKGLRAGIRLSSAGKARSPVFLEHSKLGECSVR